MTTEQRRAVATVDLAQHQGTVAGSAALHGAKVLSFGNIFAGIALRGSGAVTLVCLVSLPLGVHRLGLTPFVLLGAGAAILVGLLAALLQARTVLAPMSGLVGSQRFQIAVFGSFVLQMFVVGAGLLLLAALDVKFEALAAFGLAFAASAMLFHVFAVLQLQSVLRLRAVSAGTKGGSTGQPDPLPKTRQHATSTTHDAYQEPFRG